MADGATGRDFLVELPGSNRRPLAEARRVGDAGADEKVLVSVIVRRRPGARLGAAPASPEGTGGGAAARIEARKRFADEAGADQADLDTVSTYAAGAGMRVVEADRARRTVLIEATVAQASKAFGVTLAHYEAEGVTYRGREGHVRLPTAVADVVEAVLGLDNRPQAHVHLKQGPPIDEDELPDPSVETTGELDAVEPAARAVSKPTPLWTTQVAQLYGFPTGFDGTGETIGIIELGGGYQDSELATYFKRAKVKAPTVVSVGVDGGSNQPKKDPRVDGEVLLDIEVSGSVAPGARIVVYFADPTDRGFLDALTTAVHDATNAPSVISISWGGPEDRWTPQALKAFDAAMADATHLGTTVLCAAGDHGAGDAAGDTKVHADFPASGQNAIACGGTTLVGAKGQIVSEVVWNDGDGWATGGGISSVFAAPPWQTVQMPANLNSGKPGRGLPDVSGNADITSGYIVLSDGTWGPTGGTSAVAPLYAGLLALVNQALGRPVGALGPALYGVPAAQASTVFRDVTSGDTSVPKSGFGPAVTGYKATTGWDACTGFGSLHGDALVQYLKGAAPHP